MKAGKPKYCAACGHGGEWDAAFCVRCGKPLRRDTRPLLAGGVTLLLAASLLVGLSVIADRRPVDGTSNPHAVRRPAKPNSKIEDDPTDLMARVDQALTGHDHAEIARAVTLLDQIIHKNPHHGYALRLKANLLRNLAQPRRAAEAYRLYLERFPDDMNTRVSLGLEYLKLEAYDAAIAEWDRVAAAYPNFATVYTYLSRGHEARGDREKAQLFSQRSSVVRAGHGLQKPPLQYQPKFPDP